MTYFQEMIEEMREVYFKKGFREGYKEGFRESYEKRIKLTGAGNDILPLEEDIEPSESIVQAAFEKYLRKSAAKEDIKQAE